MIRVKGERSAYVMKNGFDVDLRIVVQAEAERKCIKEISRWPCMCQEIIIVV